MNAPIQSKINWTAAIIAAVNIAAVSGFVPDDYVPHLVALVNTIGPGLILVFRTWFTEKSE